MLLRFAVSCLITAQVLPFAVSFRDVAAHCASTPSLVQWYTSCPMPSVPYLSPSASAPLRPQNGASGKNGKYSLALWYENVSDEFDVVLIAMIVSEEKNGFWSVDCWVKKRHKDWIVQFAGSDEQLRWTQGGVSRPFCQSHHPAASGKEHKSKTPNYIPSKTPFQFLWVHLKRNRCNKKCLWFNSLLSQRQDNCKNKNHLNHDNDFVLFNCYLVEKSNCWDTTSVFSSALCCLQPCDHD